MNKIVLWGWAGIVASLALISTFTMAFSNSSSFRFAPHSSHSSCTCGSQKYRGIVEDGQWDYETVDEINAEVLYPFLRELVKTRFFRHFKVKLFSNCPFWPDDSMCQLRDCAVRECPEYEFPEPLRNPFRRLLSWEAFVCQKRNPHGEVDWSLTEAFTGWNEVDNPWTKDDETEYAEMTYVDLQWNPERYTGYTAPSARRIWDTLYSENCPKYPFNGVRREERILCKLISGLHSSISIHIAADYLLDEATNLWGQNLTLLYDRVLRYPSRVRNLYFIYLFVLRAVIKEEEYLEQADYDTGNRTDDQKTRSLMKQLLYNPKLQSACPLPFNEAKLWKGQCGPELKDKILEQFRNISAIMDCVGCEKCRLWGKLQVMGLGTAFKILFPEDDHQQLGQTVKLQRNEVIALINLLNRVSESVNFVQEMGPAAEKLVQQSS